VEKNMRTRDWMAKVPATATGQHPFAAILACMDSRNPIEIIFDQGIGDVFGIRIAGNIVNDDELGSMEYATKVVGVKLIVVLGHTSCGAVKGAIDDAKLGNLTGLLAKIRPAVSASGPGSSKDDAYVTKVAQANVSQAMKEIREKSPTIKEQLDAGTVGLVGAMYDVSTGKVTFLPQSGGSVCLSLGRFAPAGCTLNVLLPRSIKTKRRRETVAKPKQTGVNKS